MREPATAHIAIRYPPKTSSLARFQTPSWKRRDAVCCVNGDRFWTQGLETMTGGGIDGPIVSCRCSVGIAGPHTAH